MKRRPHVPLLVDAMTIWHSVFAIAIIFRHDEPRALIADLTRLSIKVELVYRLERTIGEVHLIIILIPRGTIRDRDVTHRATEAAVSVEAEYGALVGHVRDERVEHEACPETTCGVDGAVVAAVFLVLGGGNFGVGPDALDPAVLAGGLGGDTIAVFAGEDEVGGVAFDVGGAAGGL